MKRSVAMMACVLSGVLMISAYSPVVFAETTEKTEASKTDEAKDESEKKEDSAKGEVLEDGVYSAEFDTDSGMFHVNEANDGKGTLTVKDGKMTIHVSLNSKKIVNLFVGKAEDAQKDGAEILEPTTDEVTYSDGYTEEVYGFDIPVPAIDEEFDVALIGKKNKWYDHKVKVTNPQKEADAEASDTKETDAKKATAEDLKLEDLGEKFGFSYNYLSAYFNQQMNEGFNDYLNRVRIHKACEILQDLTVPVAQVSALVGYSGHSYFCRVFKKYTGKTPSEWRRDSIEK